MIGLLVLSVYIIGVAASGVIVSVYDPKFIHEDGVDDRGVGVLISAVWFLTIIAVAIWAVYSVGIKLGELLQRKGSK